MNYNPNSQSGSNRQPQNREQPYEVPKRRVPAQGRPIRTPQPINAVGQSGKPTGAQARGQSDVRPGVRPVGQSGGQDRMRTPGQNPPQQHSSRPSPDRGAQRAGVSEAGSMPRRQTPPPVNPPRAERGAGIVARAEAATKSPHSVSSGRQNPGTNPRANAQPQANVQSSPHPSPRRGDQLPAKRSSSSQVSRDSLRKNARRAKLRDSSTVTNLPLDDENNPGASLVSSILKTVIYIAVIFVISGIFSYYIIQVGNECFAFVKEDRPVEVVVGANYDINDIADMLSEEGIIEHPEFFRFYAKMRKKADVEFEPGTYTVSTATSYDKLIAGFRKYAGKVRTEISITIREGMTVDEIIELFLSHGIGTREGFVDVIQNGEFDFWFMESLTADKLSPNRTYRLEGYLFPDTYYFYSDSSEKQAIYKMLFRFNQQFDERYRASCEAIGMSVDEVITIASMIQAEAKFVTDYGLISSVFHNRINNPGGETQGYMQSDATVKYFLEEKRVVESQDLDIDNPYNTYIYKGLPPGPICNPSLDAMSYALYPDPSNYFYFVTKSNGWALFAETYTEQAQNIRIARGG